MQRNKAYLLDAIVFCRSILEFSLDITREDFLQDLKTQRAILYDIIALGEAIKRLSPEFRCQHTQLPYDDIRGLRNRAAHEYDGLDLEVVWEVITNNVPNLLNDLERIFAAMPDVENS